MEMSILVRRALKLLNLDMTKYTNPLALNNVKKIMDRFFKLIQKHFLFPYSTSNWNFSYQVIASWPFTCAQPVIPGLTSWWRAYSSA
jgi:hypothetical protein